MRLFQNLMRMSAVGPVLCLGIVCMAPVAVAQKPDPASVGPDPNQVSLGDEIMECVGGKVQLRSRLRQVETELAKLRAEATKTPEKTP